MTKFMQNNGTLRSISIALGKQKQLLLHQLTRKLHFHWQNVLIYFEMNFKMPMFIANFLSNSIQAIHGFAFMFLVQVQRANVENACGNFAERNVVFRNENCNLLSAQR